MLLGTRKVDPTVYTENSSPECKYPINISVTTSLYPKLLVKIGFQFFWHVDKCCGYVWMIKYFSQTTQLRFSLFSTIRQQFLGEEHKMYASTQKQRICIVSSKTRFSASMNTIFCKKEQSSFFFSKRTNTPRIQATFKPKRIDVKIFQFCVVRATGQKIQHLMSKIESFIQILQG